DAPYVSRRSETWLKLKTRQRQEFVVCGFTDRTGDPNAKEIGSLILGVHDDAGSLVSVGSVGTGWDGRKAAMLKDRLLPLEIDEPPFTDAAAAKGRGRWSRRAAGSERWVRPELVAEVEFAEWTPENQVRHATYVGLREDKPARAVVRESKTARAAADAPKA